MRKKELYNNSFLFFERFPALHRCDLAAFAPFSLSVRSVRMTATIRTRTIVIKSDNNESAFFPTRFQCQKSMCTGMRGLHSLHLAHKKHEKKRENLVRDIPVLRFPFVHCLPFVVETATARKPWGRFLASRLPDFNRSFVDVAPLTPPFSLLSFFSSFFLFFPSSLLFLFRSSFFGWHRSGTLFPGSPSSRRSYSFVSTFFLFSF